MKSHFKMLFVPTHLKRFLFFALFDIFVVVFSIYLAFDLRFDFDVPQRYREYMLIAFPLFVTVKIATFVFFRLYRMTWRFVSINELFNIVKALMLSEIILMMLFFIPLPVNLSFHPMHHLPIAGFPKSIFLMDAAISLILISGLRLSKRLFLEIVLKKTYKKQGKRTIVVGAGDTGEMVARDMLGRGSSLFNPVGFLDDDISKLDMYIHGIRILDSVDNLENTVRKHDIEVVVVAIPSLDHKTIRDIYDSAKRAGAGSIKIVPRIYDFQTARVSMQDLEDISIEDLIGRQKIEVDYENISNFLKDRVVLLTGAGGSIGSEIAMQVCGFHPGSVMLLDVDETELHNLGLKLKRIFPHMTAKIHFIVGDIKEEAKVREVFDTMRPQIVFHAAAYKHVPMMEYNPGEAVKVNIFGTFNLAKAAVDYGADKFIMISTDKAVRPTSVMGATKRMAEYICSAFNSNGATVFNSVRFGNVLGSRGSVLPLFLEQLKHGGPLTVTHRDMQRFFMTIPEAVSLVLQASVLGNGGDILVLDMGEPVKIVRLAEELIRLHGLEPYTDIDIEFTGMRPGEKLFEEILTAEEGTVSSRHEKVFVAKSSEKYSLDEMKNILSEFETALKTPSPEAGPKIKELLKKHVKHFSEN